MSLTNNNFTIWKTSATGLQNEVKRADGNQIANTAVISGQGNCGTTFVGNIISMQKTWDFAPEVSLVNYTEVGVGWSYIGPGSTFSRLLLPSTLPVDAGQKIRLSYQLQVSVYPTASIARPDATITGWTQVSPSGSTTQGSESIQMVLSGGPSGIGQFNYAQIQYLDYGGAVQGYSSLDPSSAGNNCSFFIATNSQSLQTFNSAIDRTGISVNGTSGFAGMYSDQGTLPYQNPYVANSFTVNKTATFGLYTMSGNSNIRSMGFGYSYQVAGYDYSTQVPYQAFCFVFDYNQYKASTQTLTLSYTWAWDRTYVA